MNATGREWEVAQERVAAGAAVLARHVPDWPQLIDRDQLDLASPCDCVLGQTILPDRFPTAYAEIRKAYGLATDLTIDGYVAARWVLDLPTATIRSDQVTVAINWMTAHGFTAGADHGWDVYVDHETLTAAWLAEIDRRLTP
jgi:hypothetical protein